MSDDEQGFPTEADTAVEFGWEDARPLTGRRLKAAKDKQKRTKAGSFGKLLLCNTSRSNFACVSAFAACIYRNVSQC